MSLHIPDTTGMVWKNGVVMSEPDSLDKYLNQAYRIWINDSYWLLMPFKLRDPGVHLSYIGRDTTQNGTSADVLEMEFTAVGVTPQNKYHIWIGGEPKEVLQWAYYRNAQDSCPASRIFGPIINPMNRRGSYYLPVEVLGAKWAT